MDAIKLATPEQVERIAATSDLGPTSLTYAMGDDLATVKQVVEIDPVYFKEESSTSRRLMFVWGLETWLRLNGQSSYYFNVLSEGDTKWIEVIEHYGAQRISRAPEFRYKKALL